MGNGYHAAVLAQVSSLLKFVLRTPVLKNAGIMQDAIQVYGIICDYLNAGPVQYTASLQFSAL